MYFIEMLNHEMSNFKDNYLKYMSKETMPSLLRLRQNIFSIKNILDDINRFASVELTNQNQIKKAEEYVKHRLKRKQSRSYANPYIKKKKKQDHAFMLQCIERKKRREEREQLKLMENIEQNENNEIILQTPME